MRSTPWPNDTLRTVNDARVPPRWTPMTTPSNTWMRSLSPSRTFTCTRTVSPDFIAGRWVNCVFSTSSSALMAVLLMVHPKVDTPSGGPVRLHLFQYRSLFVIERRRVEQIRPPRERPRDGLPFAPAPNLRVVPRQQHVRHAFGADRRRTGVMRKVEQPAAEGILRHRLIVPYHARHEARDGVNHDERGQLAPAQH